MNFQAIRNTVIVKVIYQDLACGLIIPSTANTWKKYHGDIKYQVVSVGPDFKYKDDIRSGDYVILQRHEGKGEREYKAIVGIDGVYLTVRDRWVLAKESE
ncbi:MAG: hypothetical protein MUC95_06515 [Spirochaetes bacterium]|jgi:co-chaperonin GroES (HSP10)|nr:hypothetical protein [Spirochaetota bacterium]